MRPLLKIKQVYALTAQICFNCILTFAALNFALAAVFLVRDYLQKSARTDTRISDYRQRFADREAYSRTRAADIDPLLD